MSTNVAQSTQVSERLSPDKLDVILDTLSTFGVTDASIQALKTNWPQFRFYLCEEGDMGDKPPFWNNADYSVHLVAAGLGCASFTHQLENSIGLVIELKDTE